MRNAFATTSLAMCIDSTSGSPDRVKIESVLVYPAAFEFLVILVIKGKLNFALSQSSLGFGLLKSHLVITKTEKPKPAISHQKSATTSLIRINI